jgi:hypothetical protein
MSKRFLKKVDIEGLQTNFNRLSNNATYSASCWPKINLAIAVNLMKHSDFKIGLEFATAAGLWRCADVGTRTIVAIKVTDDSS